MSAQASGLSRLLTEITARFFRAQLGRNPDRLEVVEQDGGDLVVIKVEGFLSEADAGLAKSPEGLKILGEYYARLLEQLSPALEAAVTQVANRQLLECWPAFDLSRDECLYVMTLGPGKCFTGGREVPP